MRACSEGRGWKAKTHAGSLALFVKSDDLEAPAAGTPDPKPKGNPHAANGLCGQAGARQGAVAVGGPRLPTSESPLFPTRFTRCSSSLALTLHGLLSECPPAPQVWGRVFNRMLSYGRFVRARIGRSGSSTTHRPTGRAASVAWRRWNNAGREDPAHSPVRRNIWWIVRLGSETGINISKARVWEGQCWRGGRLGPCAVGRAKNRLPGRDRRGS